MTPNDPNTAGVLSSRDRLIAGLVASGMAYPDIGTRLHLSVRTIKRAMARPEVRAEVDAMRERMVENGLGLLCNGLSAAVDELTRLVQHGTPADSVKLGAVKLTIESVLKVREQVTMARRLEETEKAVKAMAEQAKEDR